jgi:YesN/AraC family two-component response regulator
LESEKDECISLGMNGYLTKPFEEEELINILTSIQQTNVNANNPENVQNSSFDSIKEILDKVKADVGPEFVSIIVQKFSEDLPVMITDLTTHLSEEDLKSIQAKTHKLTGTLATFKFPEGMRQARIAEIASKNHKVEETAEAVSNLIVYLENTLEQLKEY